MRLFLALLPAPRARRALRDTAEFFRNRGVRGKFTREENLHLTLFFLGETDPQRLPELRAELEEACVGTSPFPAFLGPSGWFQRRGKFLLWRSLQDPAGRLGTLAAGIRRAMRGSGFRDEEREWMAHVTLVREAECQEDVRELVRSASGLPGEEFPCTDVSLMESLHRDGVLVYEPRFAVRLR